MVDLLKPAYKNMPCLRYDHIGPANGSAKPFASSTDIHAQTNKTDASKTKADIQLDLNFIKCNYKSIISSTVVHLALAHKLMNKHCGILHMYLEADQDRTCSGYEAGEWNDRPQLNGVDSGHGYGPHRQMLLDGGTQDSLPHSHATIDKYGYLLPMTLKRISRLENGWMVGYLLASTHYKAKVEP